jgi:hypothetical protein
MHKSSKNNLALLDTFKTLMVQHSTTIMQHNKVVKIMGQVTKGLNVTSVAPSGGSIKVAMKAKLLNSFVGKETKTKRM